jgi:HEAT repeat protein
VSQASQLSPELARGLLQLSRALLVAARNWTLYPPEHPTVGISVNRLCTAIRESSLGSIFSIGITPETLMIESASADVSQSGIAEAAALLHDRDLLRLTFVGDVPPEAAHALLRMLALEPADRRGRGGPVGVWASAGHPSIVMEQIDYDKMLAREEGDVPEAARRDDLWRSIVMSIAGGQGAVFDERAQERMLMIAGSPADIADTAVAASSPMCAPDGSPMITSQAAVVIAAFRHLTSIVSVMAPDRMSSVMTNIAAAATQLNPHVVMQVMQMEDDPTASVPLMRGLAGAFDDGKVAQLLATALALEGKASDRLATIFNTIAPDEDRKRRVLTMTRSMLSESDFGKAGQGGQFQALWGSMEELLVAYDDKPYVSESYQASLGGVGGRAEQMAAKGDLPPDLADWMVSLGQENVRRLSVTMLIDLFTLERDKARGEEIASDLEALAEDLLMSGAYDETLRVTNALSARARKPGAIGRDASLLALDRLAESLAMHETAGLIGDVDEAGWKSIRDVIDVVGVASIEALKPVVMVEEPTLAFERAEEAILSFGKPAVTRLASLVGDSRWFVQRNGARLLGRTGSPEAVPLLQPMLRLSDDPRVVREAVSALCAIDDPAAARAIHTVLRAATGPLRHAVIDALVAGRDPRVVPILILILRESQPLGKDHEMILESTKALGTVGSDEAVPALRTLALRRAFFGRKKLRALKEHAVAAMERIGGPKAQAALQEAATTGDRMLRKILGSKKG